MPNMRYRMRLVAKRRSGIRIACWERSYVSRLSGGGSQVKSRERASLLDLSGYVRSRPAGPGRAQGPSTPRFPKEVR